MNDRTNMRIAFKALRKQGINARMSVKDCGNGCCIMDEKFLNAKGAYVYFTKHRGFESGNDSIPERGFYLQHGAVDEWGNEVSLTDEQANLVVDTLRDNHINVSWSGDHTKGIRVDPQEQKVAA